MIPLNIWTYNNNEKITGGDFNINFKSNNTQTTEIKKLMAKNTLRQIIIDPACITTQQTLLDLIFTDSDCVKHSGLLDIHMSDHLPVFVVRNKVKQRPLNVNL